MIIQHTADNKLVLFNPENVQERKKLMAFPGLMTHGLQFYCPNEANLVYNLYSRLKRKIKDIKCTSEIKSILDEPMKILDIPEDFLFHTEPLKHQRIALRFAYTFGSFMNLSEPGLGKTKVALDFIWLMKFKKSVIVCPKPLRFVWIEEALIHRPELSVYVIETTDWGKEKDAIMAADVVVINYDKAVTLEKHLESLNADFLAVDEGLIKNPSTERTKSLTRLSKSIKYKCVMSGTLVNNSPLDVFAPIRFTQPCLTGEAFGKFRDEYSIVSRHNRFITVGYKNVDEVKSILSACSIIMTKAEWLKDLPPKEFHRIYVQMGDVQRDYYQKLASNYLLQIPEQNIEVEVDNPLSVLIKLNQISNGFIYYRDNAEESLAELYGKEGKVKKVPRKQFIFPEQPKADALIKLINTEKYNCYDGEEKNKGTRSIIWYNLAAELDIIIDALKKDGRTFLTIGGGIKDIGSVVKKFNTDPSTQFLVCQAKTINYGVTIMGSVKKGEEEGDLDILPSFDRRVSDQIFYSINFSLEVFLQQQDRIHRIGQTRICRYWMLLTNSKIERSIADRLELKLLCNKEILVDIVGSLGENLLEN